jgi:hypothetical protein
MTTYDIHLRHAEASYRDASARAEEFREKRNEVVLAALKDGWTHAQVAEITGLTRGRIGQIATSGKDAPE